MEENLPPVILNIVLSYATLAEAHTWRPSALAPLSNRKEAFDLEYYTTVYNQYMESKSELALYRLHRLTAHLNRPFEIMSYNGRHLFRYEYERRLRQGILLSLATVVTLVCSIVSFRYGTMSGMGNLLAVGTLGAFGSLALCLTVIDHFCTLGRHCSIELDAESLIQYLQ